MNRIDIKAAFSLSGRGYVIAGDITEGTIKKGMFVNYPFGSATSKIKIEAVEFLDGLEGKAISYPALVLSQKSVDELNIANEKSWLGKVYDCTET